MQELQKQKDTTPTLSGVKPSTTGLIRQGTVNHAIVKAITVRDAIETGTRIQNLDRINPKALRAYLTVALEDLIRTVDANKTISTNDGVSFAVEALITQWPTMTLEEFFYVFNRIKMGSIKEVDEKTKSATMKVLKFYERLKLAEINEVIGIYQASEYSECMEERNNEQKKEAEPIKAIDYDAYRAFLKSQKENEDKVSNSENLYQIEKMKYLKSKQAKNDSTGDVQ